jgi:4a-hydroxytetrahydrobiopterin dehydratase
MSRRRDPLAGDELAAAVAGLPGWRVVEGKLHKEYKFRDFVEAVGFMTSAALVIQEMDHHPEWFNVYSTVRIDLVTHDAGGITAMDTALAAKLEELAGRIRPA